MSPFTNWDALYAEYSEVLEAARLGIQRDKPFELEPALDRFVAPTEEDLRWLSSALRDDGPQPSAPKWFVAEVASRAESMPEALLEPMLDAAVYEINPSLNRWFVEPCMKAFGARPVNEYLLRLLEHGTDFEKAGAANALYWAQLSLTFDINAPSFAEQFATPDSRSAYQELADIWKRKRQLLLETFVANESVEVRRSVIPGLNLDPAAYLDGHQPLVAQAIAIARTHADEYIRHRVEIQLGGRGPFAPLPHREKPPCWHIVRLSPDDLRPAPIDHHTTATFTQ